MAAVDVGRPLAVLAGVVEVEHRGDAVDAQPVGVELLEPVDRVGVEEVAHLATPEVEDVGAPLLVPAALRVGVLVERRAVEAGQRPLVGGEVAGHPVEDDADAGLVQPVDEQAEAVGVAEAGVRGEVRRHVVAPRAAERVLHHRHQLDVGEAQVRRRTPGSSSASSAHDQKRPSWCFFHEREVHLVDAHRRRRRAAVGAARRSSRRRPTRSSTRRPSTPCRRASRPRPPSGRPSRATRRRGRGSRTCTPCRCRRPGTKSSQTPDVPSWRIGCSRPSQLLKSALIRTARADGAQTANDVPVTGLERARVVVHARAEHLPELLVAALVDQVQVDLAERGQEAVGVVEHDRVRAVRHRDAGSRARRRAAARRPRCPRARASSATAPPSHRTTTRGRERLEHAHRDGAVVRVRARARACGLPCSPRTTWSSSVVRDRLDGGGGRGHGVSDPCDGRERDVHPGRSVAGLVDGLVDGLVGDVGVEQHPLLGADLAAGVRHEEVVAVAVRPLVGAVGALRGALRRRPGRRCARRRAGRSRRSAASRRRRARASRAAAARRAAWRARPRSRRSSSPGWCAGSGRGAGRRGPAGRSGRGSARTRSYVARRRVGVRRQLGHDLEGGVEPGGHRVGEPVAASAPRRSVGKCSASTSCTSRSASPSRAASPAKSPPASWACRSASAKRLRALDEREVPAVAGGAQELLEHRELHGGAAAVVGGLVHPVEPAVERGDVVGAGPGEHVVHLDVGVDPGRDLAEDLHQRVLAEGDRRVRLLAGEERRVGVEVEVVAGEPVEGQAAGQRRSGCRRTRPRRRRRRAATGPSPRGRGARRTRGPSRTRAPPTSPGRRGRAGAPGRCRAPAAPGRSRCRPGRSA